MIHTSKTVAVGNQESIIDSPIVLYRGDREVEVEFTLTGNKYTFSNGGNVIKSVNATHGQLVLNTPTGENAFSEVTECHDGKVVFVITKEMIDELIEVGFYSFQIRLFDENQVSRVSIPPVYKGIDIRNPIAAEDETNVVDIGLVDYAVVVKDEFEDLSTFLPDGNYNKTEWESKDVISGAKLNKIEDALYNINSDMEATDLALLNRIENINQNVYAKIGELGNELDSEVEEFERDLNNNVERFKTDINGILEGYKNATKVVNVLDFGAIGDGLSDDTNPLFECFNYCVDNNFAMFIPNGTYILNKTLKKSSSIDSAESYKPIRIIGETAYGVFIETRNNTRPLIDVTRSRYVFMENLLSNTSWFNVIQYGGDRASLSRVRDVYICNVGSLSVDSALPYWNLLINTPAPSNYNKEEVDSRYTRYALEIHNNSGYNPIMITNTANTNDDGTPGYPSDQSAIGIVDDVSNATGVILIEGTKRSFIQCKNEKATNKSEIRHSVVYEVNQNGHIATGCSTDQNDEVAKGNYSLKIRESYPTIALYDMNRGNRQTVIGASNDQTYIHAYDENGNATCGIDMDYKNRRNMFIGSVQLGKLLVWGDTSANKNLNGVTSIYVPSNITSRFENVDDGVEGQIVSIVSDGTLTIQHHKDGWGNIRTASNGDVILDAGCLYTLTRINGKWYLK